MPEHKGKHRADDQPDKKSTSERIQGTRNDASKSEHRSGRLGFGLGTRKDAKSRYHYEEE